MVRAMRRLLLILVVLLIGLPVIYVGVAFGLSIATKQQAFVPHAGISIYACDNGVHADLVMPIWVGDVNWTTFVPDVFPGRRFRPDYYLSFGWGSRDFYINTPRWSDVRVGTAVKALLWDDTVVHVEYRARPTDEEGCGAWLVDDDGYNRIAAYVRGAFRLADGMPHPLPVAAGYGPNDVFYAANGRYTVFNTCNQWTGQALRTVGAPVASWTPFSFLVLWKMTIISI